MAGNQPCRAGILVRTEGWERPQSRKRETPPPPPGYDVDLIFPSFDRTLRDPVDVNHQGQRVQKALGLSDDPSPCAFREPIASTLDDAKPSARVTTDVLHRMALLDASDRYHRCSTIFL
ncbi:hypothetical protein [Nocardia brevicatena]|uniref:hypothetical protein n=1 Tax=Nocardia brevicatena TaxID=37327 RepID=UPI001C3F3D95|nr:hypothetical protein [Nocardia brevicatena]